MPYLVETVVPSISGKQVALHALARHVAAVGVAAGGDLVDLVEENDAVLLDRFERLLLGVLVADQPSGFFLGQQLECLAHFQLAGLPAALPDVLEHALQLLRQVFHSRRGEDFHAGTDRRDLDLDFLVVELAFAQHLAETLARRAFLALRFGLAKADAARRRQQRVEDAIFGGFFGAKLNLGRGLFAHLLDRGFHQVADDGVDIASDVADFGELGRLDLDEGRVGEPRQPSRDLGLADPGRPDHQDVLRRDFLPQRLIDLLAPPAVAQGDRDRALGGSLADDVFVEFVDDFFGGHRDQDSGARDQGVLSLRAFFRARPAAA